MPERYYLDTCIWIDYLEDRKDKFRPIGEYASVLLKTIVENNDIIVFSNLVEKELKRFYSEEQASAIPCLFPSQIIEKVRTTKEQLVKAMKLSKESALSINDAIHAILAKDNDAILVTRDRHFRKLKTSQVIKSPEELV